MRKKRWSLAGWPLAVLAAVALIIIISAGCTNASDGADSSGANNGAADHDQAVKFAECMREKGVSAFPDPQASGQFTIDGIANGSSLNPNSSAFRQAIDACKDLEPPGFTGQKRSPEQQESALKFAECMRDNGVADFPDPTPDGPLISVNGAHSIPGFQAAKDKCRDYAAGAMNGGGQ